MNIRAKSPLLMIFFGAILVLSVGNLFYEYSAAEKSVGTSLSKTLSEKVCGVILCDFPMTIKQKIELYISSFFEPVLEIPDVPSEENTQSPENSECFSNPECDTEVISSEINTDKPLIEVLRNFK